MNQLTNFQNVKNSGIGIGNLSANYLKQQKHDQNNAFKQSISHG
jgi:hypothetical protein